MKQPCVYIMANRRNGTICIGVTNQLDLRVCQHKMGVISGFTCQSKTHMLVYYEAHASIEKAIRREKQLKNWKRSWKVHLIEQLNPLWRDLYTELS
ncbi:GIY-YIG nuclease family protein [Marinicella sediminis]|uniref:GIY-YIG nuclease family protein n=1 Tax=Marinicella sediminis TaxID=1792834 RepID=A0ABV7JB85_9GAMM|nr:GIY-YIG nuclease family protein [Marinicella sediminis]